jgi:riboflavin biosynthesis pyrimidine reductase
MRILWPTPSEGDDDDVDPVAVVAAEARPSPPERPWVLANMIASADGSATDAGGRSGGLGGPADKAVFGAVRAVADVVVAGSATVITEDYGPSRPPARVRDQRVARGQAPAPRIAVTSASLAIEPTRRLFAEASPDARPLVLTVAAADPARRRALEAVADVHVVGDEQVDWARAFALLHAELEAGVVLCEGGPSTIGQLVADDLLDELCVTIAPVLVAGDGPRIARRAAPVPDRGLSLARILAADDHLFVRYLRAR